MDRRVVCKCGGVHWALAQGWLLAQHGGPAIAATSNKAPEKIGGEPPPGVKEKKQGWSREKYNEYQRGLMRERRAAAKKAAA